MCSLTNDLAGPWHGSLKDSEQFFNVSTKLCLNVVFTSTVDLKYFFLRLSCSIIFVNNFAFGPEVDHQLKERFANMKEGWYF